MNNNFSSSFSQPLSVDSDMPKSRNTFAWLLPLLTHSTAFTLSLTVHTFQLWLNTTLCYCANNCCSDDGVACPRCHPHPAAARPALYKPTALSPSPVYSAGMFIIRLHPPSPVRLARLLQSITVYTRAIAGPTVLALSPLTWNYACLKNRGPWPQPRYNRIRITLKRVITRVQRITW